MKAASLTLVCASLALCAAGRARAQSADLGSPTPVYGPEIAGRIAPLDVGDPRQTRHFYTFNARPGDLEINVEASNLDGEIDLFTATAMRPLAQITLYSGLGPNVARTVFFRRDETVVLRVQARSPNDSEGTYRIRLGGTFAPSTLPPPAEESASNAAPAGAKPAPKGVRRVNSIGARIEEPKVETPAEPAPSERAEAGNAPAETATPKPATNKKTPARANTANRTGPARRGSTRRGAATRTSAPSTEAAKTEVGKSDTTEPTATPTTTAGEPTREETPRSEPARTATGANRSRANRGRSPRANAGSSNRATANANASEPAANKPESSGEPAAPAGTSSAGASGATAATGLEAPGSRVVLEMRDGTRVERAMSEVRRVSVEGRLVVITLKNGRVERHPLADVQRMSIEP